MTPIPIAFLMCPVSLLADCIFYFPSYSSFYNCFPLLVPFVVSFIVSPFRCRLASSPRSACRFRRFASLHRFACRFLASLCRYRLVPPFSPPCFPLHLSDALRYASLLLALPPFSSRSLGVSPISYVSPLSPPCLPTGEEKGQADWCAIEDYSEVGRYVFPDLWGFSLLIRGRSNAIFL